MASQETRWSARIQDSDNDPPRSPAPRRDCGGLVIVYSGGYECFCCTLSGSHLRHLSASGGGFSLGFVNRLSCLNALLACYLSHSSTSFLACIGTGFVPGMVFFL